MVPPAPENAVVEALTKMAMRIRTRCSRPARPTSPSRLRYCPPRCRPDATVRIYYKNADGTQDVATMQERKCPAGAHQVT